MPANVKRIEFAKSYGDLSENAEYQYAKDEQRALMQKQSLMQADLEVVKPWDFSDAVTDEVMPGVTVVIAAPDGERTYHVLGEWDNDTELGVLSCKAKLAQNMLGKKVGDQFELPGFEGAAVFATVLRIEPLFESIREWIKLPSGMQI
jgi:transcription elongation factor GreA